MTSDSFRLKGPTPIESAGEQLSGPWVPVPDDVLRRIAAVCPVDSAGPAVVEAGRDWWPLSARWATKGFIPRRPAAVSHPTDEDHVSALLAICNESHVPVTVAGGRSGVCGGSVPVFGGLSLDLCSLDGIVDVDEKSMTARVRPGTFGPDLESALAPHGLTLGHFPQSMDISTVGGWLACRGAGQLSTRYGKIEDMVRGLRVALADGSIITTGGTGPGASTGPDLTQIFVGSEGTLGVITEAALRLHRIPERHAVQTWAFAGFAQGLEACREFVQRGATPAVVRLYDEVESERNFNFEGRCVLVVMDESSPWIVEPTMAVVESVCRANGAERLDDEVADMWASHRFDVSALGTFVRMGAVVDTIEITGPWSSLEEIFSRSVAGLASTEGMISGSAHLSHAYSDGGCLYFTFGGLMPEGHRGHHDPAAEAEWAEGFYTGAWDTVMEAVGSAGGAISHHHGIGLNRARYMRESLGPAFDVLAAVKAALDPRGILNPGKLDFDSPYGEVSWP